MTSLRRPIRLLAAVVLLGAACLTARAEEPQFTEEQIKEFLRKAKVVNSRKTAKGITSPWRLTLSDGTVTHDACYQNIEQFEQRVFRPGRAPEFDFRDSYQFNIAAYELAELLGLGGMIPVTVERKWKGKKGSLSWWVPAELDEQQRSKENLQPPDSDAWNRQMNRMWVFSQLVYDTDRNQTNMLITKDWKLVMIDFSRAFRTSGELEEPRRLVQCCRKLMEKLRQLEEAQVREATRGHLDKARVQAIMKRRDKIVAHFEQLVAQKGEGAVLY